jgi:hypothetical protein
MLENHRMDLEERADTDLDAEQELYLMDQINDD